MPNHTFPIGKLHPGKKYLGKRSKKARKQENKKTRKEEERKAKKRKKQEARKAKFLSLSCQNYRTKEGNIYCLLSVIYNDKPKLFSAH